MELKKKRLTLPMLATRTGISRQTLANWSYGQKSKDLEQVKLIADFFNVSLDYLCFGENILREPFEKESLLKYEKEIMTGVFEVVLRRRS